MSLDRTPSCFILCRIAPSGMPMLFIFLYFDMSVAAPPVAPPAVESVSFLVFFFCPRFLMAAIMADCGDSGGAFFSSSPLLPPHAVLPVKLPPPLGEFIRRAAELAAALFTVGDPVGDLEDRLVPSHWSNVLNPLVSGMGIAEGLFGF